MIPRWLLNGFVLFALVFSPLQVIAASDVPVSSQETLASSLAAPGDTWLISKTSPGAEAFGDSFAPAVSPDGRFISFTSIASGLSTADNNFSCYYYSNYNCEDVFVLDRQTGMVEQVSVASDGTGGNLSSGDSDISEDGRFVVFASSASNLVVNDTNGSYDVFVHDRQTGVTSRVSVASDGAQGDGDSRFPSISADGRFVAFTSRASNFGSENPNHYDFGYVHDRQTGEIRVVTRAANDALMYSGGVQISDNGRYVVFTSQSSELDGAALNIGNVFVNDLQSGITERLSVAPDGAPAAWFSRAPSISADGRYVAFWSVAWNLVPGDDNALADIFVRDRLANSTMRIPVEFSVESGNNNIAPVISGDGKYVTLNTKTGLVPEDTDDLDDTYVIDWASGTIEWVSASSGADGGNYFYAFFGVPAISFDGRYVAFSSAADNLIAYDENYSFDVFVRDREEGATTRASVISRRFRIDAGSPTFSGDGHYVLFSTGDSRLVAGDTNQREDVFLYNLETDTVERVSLSSSGKQGAGGAEEGALSYDGRLVVFSSYSDDLVTGDTNEKEDIFIRDRQTGTTRLISAAPDDGPANNDSYSPLITPDGRFIVFTSRASNLVAQDTNETEDVFIYDDQTGSIELVSIATDGTQGNGIVTVGRSVTPDGRFVGFNSYASNMVPGDTNNTFDVFIRDRQTGITERISSAMDGTAGDASSYGPSISTDGRFVSFSSGASNLVADDTNWCISADLKIINCSDVFVFDRLTKKMQRVSVGPGSQQSNNWSSGSSISSDGRFVAFQSIADNLVEGDTNQEEDLFVYDRLIRKTERVSVASDGTQGDASSGTSFQISSDGSLVVFSSLASNFISKDLMGEQINTGCLYVHERSIAPEPVLNFKSFLALLIGIQ